MKAKKTLLYMLVICSIPFGNAQELKTSKSFISAQLNEKRELLIATPQGYGNNDKKYPVLYLLDGKTHFAHATNTVNYLTRFGAIPDLIVVAVVNIDRNRDFTPVSVKQRPTTGGAEKFMTFIKEELIPYINKNYSTSGFNIIMGHSLGGVFASYALLHHPNVFDAYIAVSPYLMYADNYLLNEVDNTIPDQFKKQKFYYMTVGNEPNYFETLVQFSRKIEGKQAIAFKYEQYLTENHGTMPYLGIYLGLRHTFKDWQVTQQILKQGLEKIDLHYKTLATTYGVAICTPENVINALGYIYLQNNEQDRAIEVFLENVRRYPKSPNVYDSLGEAYENKKKNKLARENYQKAYDLGLEQNHEMTAFYLSNLNRMKGQNKP